MIPPIPKASPSPFGTIVAVLKLFVSLIAATK